MAYDAGMTTSGINERAAKTGAWAVVNEAGEVLTRVESWSAGWTWLLDHGRRGDDIVQVRLPGLDLLSRYDVRDCSDAMTDRFYAYRQAIADLRRAAGIRRRASDERRDWRRAVGLRAYAND